VLAGRPAKRLATMELLASTTAAGTPLDPQHLGRHLTAMHRVARALCAGDGGRNAEPDDLVQDALERVLRRPRTIHTDAGPYLMQAVRHAYLDRRRARGARVVTTPELAEAVATDVRATAAPALAVEVREVLGTIHALPAAYRQAVVALDVLGYSAREASEATGVPTGTLESRAHRGRAKVVAALAA
jgi:RNA polymerase sigma-70 factor (ECF subfamily)